MSIYIGGMGVLPRVTPLPETESVPPRESAAAAVMPAAPEETIRIFLPLPVVAERELEPAPTAMVSEVASAVAPEVAPVRAVQHKTNAAVASFGDDEKTQVSSSNAADFLATLFTEREMLLSPILPAQGLAMLYSRRGVGKTYMALGMAHAVARGGSFLRWNASRARRVLYVDGELPASILQQRLRSIIAGLDAAEPTLPDPSYLKIITPDLQRSNMPDLSTLHGQRVVENRLEGGELLVLDNLSCLCRTGKESEGESWLPVQDWALRLRQQGTSVLFIHHAGKGGQQRGTSRREDLLDTVIALRQPEDYSPTEGLRCQVRFEKARSFSGEDARPFEVQMEITADGIARWTMTAAAGVDDPLVERAIELFSAGLKVREVASALNISKTRAGRLRNYWSEEVDREV